MNPFLFRRIRGPVFLLCFALTAILNQWHILPFSQSWPLYLITAGMLRIVESLVLVAVPFAGYPQAAWPRRRSLTGGIVLLGVGVIALLVTTGLLPSFAFWSGYAMWWPLLLVLLGVLLLVERLLDRGFYSRRYPNGAQVPYRRHHGGGLVGLVVLLIVLGVFSHHHRFMWNGNEDWNWPSDWNFNFGGETYEHDVTLSQSIPANAVLTIDNGRGDVQIAPSSDGMVHVQAHQSAHVPERRKEGAFEGARPQLSVHGSEAGITVPEERNVDVRLQVQVPATVRCTVHTSHGDVAVSGSQQPVDITDDHGDVTLDSLGAGAHLAMDHGNLQARSVAGDVVVDGRADDINLSGIGGKTVLQGEFFGDTELDSIKGSVAFRSSRTNLDLGKLTGSLSLDSDNLRVSGASGGVRLTTRSKDVEADGITGEATITDSNGDIHLLAQQPLGPITLTNSTGDITLRLPANAAFNLSGQTNTDDTIESDWGLVQSTQGDSKTIRGQVGTGGPQIVLRTDHGDLTLRRASAADEDRPEQPEKPERPEKPEHLPHLHTAAPPATPTVQ